MIIRAKDQLITTTSHGKHLKKVILDKDVIPSLLQFAYSEFRTGDIIEKHFHNSMAEVFYILNGSMEINLMNHYYIAEKGDCISIRAREEHSFKFLEKTKIIYLNICDENPHT